MERPLFLTFPLCVIYLLLFFQPVNAQGCEKFVGNDCAELVWEEADARSGEVAEITISLTNPNVMYADIEVNAHSLYKSTDGGNSWNNYQLSTSGYTITVSPSDANRVLFGKIDGFYLSTNGLQSENKVIEIGEDQRISDVQFAPSNSNVVYAITQGSYLLYKSTDGGATFSKIKDIRNEVLNVIS